MLLQIGAGWKMMMSDADRAKYVKLAEEDTNRFTSESEKYERMLETMEMSSSDDDPEVEQAILHLTLIASWSTKLVVSFILK